MIPTSSSSSASTPPTVDVPPPAWLSASSNNGSDGMFLASGSGSGQQQMAISNGVLLAAVIFLFMVVVFVFLLYLYAKRYLGANPLLAPGSHSSRFLFVDASPLPQRGLPDSFLRSLPVTVYAAAGAGPGSGSPKDKEKDKDALECAVCLSEVADGEKVRTLPKCGHGFHVECIDMWFHSHDTCPLCRAPVGAAADLDTLPREEPSGASLEFPVFPTNVLFWGTHDEVTNAGLAAPAPPPPTFASAATASASSSASGRRKENQLVIDIPSRGPVALNTSPMNSPLPASRMPGSADNMRSPVSARLRSLRRLLSRGKQAVVGTSSSYSPSPRAAAGDIEQGLAGAESARPPKTPKTPKTPPSSGN